MKIVKTVTVVLVLALVALFLRDDLKTFVSGGHSLINWGSKTAHIITGVVVFSGALGIAVKGTLWVIRPLILSVRKKVLNRKDILGGE